MFFCVCYRRAANSGASELLSTRRPTTLILNSSSRRSFAVLVSQGNNSSNTGVVARTHGVLSRTGGNQGEVESPLAGEMRLQSDSEVPAL